MECKYNMNVFSFCQVFCVSLKRKKKRSGKWMHQNGRTICVFALCFLAFLMLHRIEPILSGDTKTICEGLCVTLWKKTTNKAAFVKQHMYCAPAGTNFTAVNVKLQMKIFLNITNCGKQVFIEYMFRCAPFLSIPISVKSLVILNHICVAISKVILSDLHNLWHSTTN